MLKFFFNRFSKVVTAMEILGVVFTLLWLSKSPPKILITVYIAQYLFLRFCASWRWHKEAGRYEGIELHFKKVMTATAYLLAITSGVGYGTGSSFLLWVANLVFAFILYVNGTLLYLYYKDKNKTPINFYSGNKFHNALR